jgi:hypothetical protein
LRSVYEGKADSDRTCAQTNREWEYEIVASTIAHHIFKSIETDLSPLLHNRSQLSILSSQLFLLRFSSVVKSRVKFTVVLFGIRLQTPSALHSRATLQENWYLKPTLPPTISIETALLHQSIQHYLFPVSLDVSGLQSFVITKSTCSLSVLQSGAPPMTRKPSSPFSTTLNDDHRAAFAAHRHDVSNKEKKALPSPDLSYTGYR